MSVLLEAYWQNLARIHPKHRPWSTRNFRQESNRLQSYYALRPFKTVSYEAALTQQPDSSAEEPVLRAGPTPSAIPPHRAYEEVRSDADSRLTTR